MTAAPVVIDYKKLGKAIAEEMRHQHMALTLNHKELAYSLGYAPYSSSMYSLIEEPGFPQPKPLMPGGEPRWLLDDVKAFLRGHYDRSKEMLAVS